jgi:hypothetical protein
VAYYHIASINCLAELRKSMVEVSEDTRLRR